MGTLFKVLIIVVVLGAGAGSLYGWAGVLGNEYLGYAPVLNRVLVIFAWPLATLLFVIAVIYFFTSED